MLENHDGVLAQLERILASQTFRNAGRLSRFLRFTVEAAVRGEADRIKEYSVGVEVFDRDASYDPRIDPVVRVEARRLRAKLVEYYNGEGSQDPLRIDLPKGSYVPAFSRPVQAPARGLNRRVLFVAASLLLAGVLYLAARPAAPVRLAVLPMRVYSPPDPEPVQRMSDAAVEAVLRQLSGDRALSLVSWPTVFEYRAAGKKTPEIGRDLRAANVAVVWVRQQEGKLFVTAHLVGAARDEKLWAHAWTLPAGAARVPDGVTIEMASAIRRRLSGEKH